MAIVAGDIKLYLSGGAGNSNPNASLGGVISTTEVVDNTLHNLFDRTTGTEAIAGDTEYRCIYIKNIHATLTYLGALIWIQTQTPDTQTSIEIGLGTSAISGIEQTIVNENTAPTGITWTALTLEANALSIGDMLAGEWKAIWVKRIVGVASSVYDNDSVVLQNGGDTTA